MLCTIIVLLLAVLPAHALTGTPDPAAIPANQLELVRVTFTGAVDILNVNNVSLPGGDATVVGGTFTGPNPVLELVVIADGTSNPVTITFDLDLSTGPSQICTAQLGVNPAGNQLPVITVSGINEGDTLNLPSPPLILSGNVFFPSGATNPEMVIYNDAAPPVVATLTPQGGGTFSFSESVTPPPGNSMYFIHARDPDCATCDGAIFNFTVVSTGGPGGLPLPKPQYIGISAVAQPYQSAPITDSGIGFGRAPAASSDCCGGGQYHPTRGNGVSGQDGAGVDLANGRLILRDCCG